MESSEKAGADAPAPFNPPPGPIPVSSWIGPALCGLVIAIFYLFVGGFDTDGSKSVLVWLRYTWNSELDFEHGFLVPVVMVGLLIWHRKALRAAAGPGHWSGILPVVFGCLLYVLAHRTGQPRLAAIGLPFILWGSSLFLWGFQVARLTLVPFFLFGLAIHVPQFQQATTILQILSTKLAQFGCSLFGVATEVRGTQIMSANSTWSPLEIDDGCGGIRSLMALTLIATVWAYISKISLWKKAVLLFSAIPLAILGNMFRLTSIFVITEYGNARFAAETWHDWSGLLLFYPFSLALLLGLHSLLEGGLPWKKPKKRLVRQAPANQPA